MIKRLRDWWTRPSVDEMISKFLDEHKEELIAFMSKPSYQELEAEVDRLRYIECEKGDLVSEILSELESVRYARTQDVGRMELEIDRLPKQSELDEAKRDVAELQGLLDRIDTQIGDALESVGRFPPKPAGFPDRVDRLIGSVKEFSAEIKKLHASHNEFVDSVSGDVVALPFAMRRVEELEAEVDRLRKLGIESVEKAPIHSIDIEPSGAVSIVSAPPHWAVREMAASFLETLDAAPNWRALEIGPIPSDGGMLIATVCRASGDSPVETVGKLKEMIEQLLDTMDPNRHTDLYDCALALINPEKKD